MSSVIFRHVSRSTLLFLSQPLRATATPSHLRVTSLPVRARFSRSSIQQRTIVTETNTKTVHTDVPPCGDRCTCDYKDEKNKHSTSRRLMMAAMASLLLVKYLNHFTEKNVSKYSQLDRERKMAPTQVRH
ncbi:MAG: hypothetical protein J3R72DRAFT_182806 [Linnemannia gamsii]|nr:MAG: hypothetical protein J3R72DRAFT_182806 [Linnemannia gamsii]